MLVRAFAAATLGGNDLKAGRVGRNLSVIPTVIPWDTRCHGGVRATALHRRATASVSRDSFRAPPALAPPALPPRDWAETHAAGIPGAPRDWPRRAQATGCSPRFESSAAPRKAWWPRRSA